MASSDTTTNNQHQSNDSSNPVVYDDELDENFEDNFAKTATTAEMKTTLESFDNPLGLEESPESPVMGGPQLDQKEIERFRKQVMNMPKNELMKFFRNIATQNNLGLGDNNFRSVSGDHRNDIKNKLRQKLNQRNMARKPKNVRTREIERREASMKELKRKDNDQHLEANQQLDMYVNQQPDATNPDINALLENLSNAMGTNDNHANDNHANDNHANNNYACDSPSLINNTIEDGREMASNNMDRSSDASPDFSPGLLQ